MTNNGKILRLEGVYKSFGQQKVLDGISLTIAAGSSTVIIGPSGCGKTVLLKHMIGLLRPDRGKVFFWDDEISAIPEKKLFELRRRMGFLFQSGALFDSMTVEENVCFPLAEHDVGTPEERIERAKHVLSIVGLESAMDKYPEELSGGQKKRVALARAIALDPEVIFYDEPTTGLDPIRADLINELICKLHDEFGATAVIVTHDMASARKVGDRIIMLHEGRIVADAPPEKLGQIHDDIVVRFIEGRASKEELAEIEGSRPSTPGNGGSDKRISM